jgi:hypothetical protein
MCAVSDRSWCSKIAATFSSETLDKRDLVAYGDENVWVAGLRTEPVGDELGKEGNMMQVGGRCNLI